METIKQKIEGQSTKDTEVAPVVQIVTEEEYIELFWNRKQRQKHFMEIGVRLDWKVQRRHHRQSVGDNSIEAAESYETNKGEELQERESP